MQFGWPKLQKPGRGAYLDVTHPLARGLLAFYALNEGDGVSCGDSAGNAPPLALFSGTTWGSGLSGGLLATAASRGAYATLPAGLQVPYPVTIASAQRILGSGTNSQWGINSSAAFSSVYGFARGSSTLFLQWLSGSTGKSVNTNITTATGLDFVASATITASGAVAYLNGVQSATSVTANSNPTYPGTSYLAIGDSPGNTSNPNALYYWMLILGRALSAAEHAAMFASPSAIWPLLATGPLRSWVFFQGTGALAGSSSGGIVAGGSSAPSVSYSPPASGGAVLGGTAVGSPIFAPPAIGGAIVGGTAAPSALFSPPPSGGAVLGGAAAGSLAGPAAGVGVWRRGHKPERGAYLDISHPLARVLAGIWALNEGDGVPFNPVTRTAAASNSMTWSAGPAPRRGTLQNAGGTAKSVQIPVAAGSPLDITGKNISFGAWVYPTVSNVFQTIISLNAGGTDALRQYSLYLHSAGTAALYISMGGAAIIVNNTNVVLSPRWSVNAWNHILVTYDGARVRIYVNGVPAGSLAATASIAHVANSSLYFGYDGGFGGFGLNGYLDAPTVWNRCLTDAEAAAIGGTPGGIWQVFAPGPLRTIYSGSGAIVLAGSSSGGVVAGGSASPSAAFTATASGGAVVGGLATPAATFVVTASGGPVAGGAAQPTGSNTFTAIASGGPVVGGVAAPTATFAATARGGIVAGGSAQPVLLGGAAATTFRQALHAQLLATPAVTAIVGASVYPGSLPRTHDLERDGPALTYAVFRFSTGFRRHPGHNLSGSDGTIMARVRFDAWSYQYSESDAITAALYQALEGLINATWGTTAIVSCIHANEVDIATPDPVRRNLIYQITSEYDLRYRIAIPARS